MRSEVLALESVEKPPAFHGVFAGHGCRSGGLASPSDGKDVWNVQPECRRVPVRGKVCERKPPCREKQVSAIFVDQRGTHTRYRAVLFIYEQARIGVGKSGMAAGGNGRGELEDNDERGLIVALQRQRLAVASFLPF